jgi:hypothetical protein
MAQTDDKVILDYAPVRERELVQSRWGVAAVWCAAIAFIAGWVSGIVASTGNPPLRPSDQKTILVPLLVVTISTLFGGLVFGTIGCVQKKRRRFCAIIGMSLCVLVLFLMILAVTLL